MAFTHSGGHNLEDVLDSVENHEDAPGTTNNNLK